jgi:sigma-B regulation protein RsbU (phosphoserine phosphatase)
MYLWAHLRATRDALLSAERVRIGFETQLAIAADIQQRLLPATATSPPGIAFAAHLEAAQGIGGDFYDWVDRGPTTRIVLVADISGKGIPAALLLAYTRALFRQAARESSAPADILRTLSKAIHEDTAGKPYLTCIVATFDLAGRTLAFANAGHPAGVLVGERGVRRLEAGGPPAGLLPFHDYAQQCVPLAEGDVGALVTDGVVESFDDDRDAIAGVLMASRRAGPGSPEAICADLLAAARGATGPAGVDGWADDRTAVVFVVGPPGAR